MNTPKLFLIAAAWAATVGGAYFIGTASSPEGATAELVGESAAAGNAKSDSTTATSKAERAAVIVAAGEGEEAAVKGGSLPSFAEMMAAYLNNANTPGASEHLSMMIQGLGAGDIANARNLIEGLPAGAVKDKLMVELVGRWAMFEPTNALAYAQGLPTMSLANNAVREALEGWARTDATGALAWWDSDANDATGRLRNQRFESIMEGYARTDAFAAFQYAGSLPEDSLDARRLKNRAIETVVDSMVESGNLDNALVWANQLPDGEAKTTALSEVLEEWARYDPDAAANYLGTLEGRDDYADLRDSMLRTWAESDPVEAAAYLSQMDPEDPELSRLTTMLVAQWSRYDIAGPGEWLNNQPPSPDLDRAVAIFTFRAASEDPAGAMTWAESITSDGMRDRLMTRVASEWKEQDPEGFTAYIETAELTPEQKTELEKASSGGGRGGRGGFWGRGR